MSGLQLFPLAVFQIRFEHLLITGFCLQACFKAVVHASNAIAGDDLEFKMFDGYIAGEDDIASEYLTLTKAKERCSELPDCRGFTFMGGPSEGPMWVNFKAAWNIAGTGWTSYRR